MNREHIPEDLRQLEQWVCWRQEQRNGDKPTKVPVNPSTGALAKTNDPSTWGSYDEAVAAIERLGCTGLGFVFSSDDPYAGVDLDDCYEDGTLGRMAQTISEGFATYTEVSPSGKGLHCILRGKVLPGARKQSLLGGQPVEVYSEGRFFCMTGDTITNGTPINDAQPQLEDLCLRLAEKTRENGGTKLGEGEGRNNELTRRLGGEVARGVSGTNLAQRAHELNDFHPPLAEEEVAKIVRSAEKWPAGEASKAGHYHLTELGNAERLAARHAGSVYAVRGANELRAYDPARGIYTAEHGLLLRYATDVVRSMYAEAGDDLTDDAKALRNHAKRSETKRALDAMLELSKSLVALEAEAADFDADPELLNTQNGVVDLASGELHRHDAKYRMTKMAGCAYTPGAATPLWDAFLERIFEGDRELIAFMQRLFGYALSGYIGEQIFAIFFGAGANGKSVLVDCWQAAMGDYAGVAALKTFLPHSNDAVRTDLATLNGQRLVSTSESKPGQLIDAATIKVLTSKHVTCRFNYARGESTYTPQYLVVLDTNFKPQVQCDDYAIKRRVLLVPFNVLIPEAEQDKKFTEKLIAAELPGILAWGVAGASDYLAQGLCIPERVRAATEAYRAEMDQLHEFWGQWLTFTDAQAWSTAEALRDALTAWAKVNGVEQRDLPKGGEWGRQLRERGARSDKKKLNGKTVSVWYGVHIVGADVQQELN